jgi:hypothetical protein
MKRKPGVTGITTLFLQQGKNTVQRIFGHVHQGFGKCPAMKDICQTIQQGKFAIAPTGQPAALPGGTGVGKMQRPNAAVFQKLELFVQNEIAAFWTDVLEYDERINKIELGTLGQQFIH